MKRIALLAATAILIVTAAEASGRWSISAGANTSHMCDRLTYDQQYGWGFGAFAGGGYEMNLNSHWSFMPQLNLEYVDNGATLDLPDIGSYFNRQAWRASLSAVVPLEVGFRFKLSDNTGMRISAGPYLQEAIMLRRYDDRGDKKVNSGVRFIDRLNFGMSGGIAVETGSHLAYLVSARYPVLRQVWSRRTLTLSVGLRYYF